MSKQFDEPLSPSRSVQQARKELEKSIHYVADELGDVRLASVLETMHERRSRLGLEEDNSRQVVFSLDKGRGRVTSTLSFVHHPRPNSCYNHLPVQVRIWIVLFHTKDHFRSGKGQIPMKL